MPPETLPIPPVDAIAEEIHLPENRRTILLLDLLRKISLSLNASFAKGVKFVCRGPIPEAIQTNPDALHGLIERLVLGMKMRTEVAPTASGSAASGSQADRKAGLEIAIRIAGAERAKLLFEFRDLEPRNDPPLAEDQLLGPFERPALQAGAASLGGKIVFDGSPGDRIASVLAIDPGPLLAASYVDPVRANRKLRIAGASRTIPLLPTGCRILLAEDYSDLRIPLAYALTQAGGCVDQAADRTEAFVRFRQSLEQGMPYAAIVLDLELPEEDLAASARQIREHAWGGGLIALRANPPADWERDAFLASGWDELLAKPVDLVLLIEGVKRFASPATAAAPIESC